MANSTDPFAASGGGVYRDGGWKPRNMYNEDELAAYDAQQSQAAAQPPQTPGAPPPPSAYQPALPSTPVVEQAKAAATYSATPGAAPVANTTNQGTQDVVRNSYLERATQGTQVSTSDPNIQAQAQPFAAAQERARRQHESESAERLSAQGLGNSGAMDTERRLASERAGQATGMFEAQLVGREIENRRQEIKDALTGLYGAVSADQLAALNRELAQLDAQTKMLGIQTGASTAGAELGLRGQLGNRELDLDALRIAIQNQQFGDTLGFNVADREAYYNNAALNTIMNGGR